MLKVFDEHYFIDLDAIEQYLDISESESEQLSGTTEIKVNLIKFEMVKMLLETMLTEQEVPDEKMGLKGSTNTSLPFRLAFNSLLNKKLINYY
jgi:hypothetical protein